MTPAMFRCQSCGAEVTTVACGLCGWSPTGELLDQLRSEVAYFDGTAGQDLADLLGRVVAALEGTASALESEYARGYQEGLDDERL